MQRQLHLVQHTDVSQEIAAVHAKLAAPPPSKGAAVRGRVECVIGLGAPSVATVVGEAADGAQANTPASAPQANASVHGHAAA